MHPTDRDPTDRHPTDRDPTDRAGTDRATDQARLTRAGADRAGASQAHAAARERARAAQLEREHRLARRQARKHDVASRTEAAVAATLGGLTVYGWRLLADRRWPGSTTANVDLVLVGPGGVFVIDVKAWAEPRIEGDRLYRGDADETERLDAFAGCAAAAADALAENGLAPSTVTAALVLAGRELPATRVAGAVVVGEKAAVPWALRRRVRLDDAGVVEATRLVEQVFPPWQPSSTWESAVPEDADGGPLRHRPTPHGRSDNASASDGGPTPHGPTPHGPTPHGRGAEASAPHSRPLSHALSSSAIPPPPLPRHAETAELFDVDALVEAELTRAARAPLEHWATWLHPEQRPLVTRRWHGPARLSGPAGTGKTVVALHRVARAARRPGARVLVTTLVRTLPKAFGGWLDRLVPEHAAVVERASLHGWARQLLIERDHPFRLAPDRAELLFNRTWLDVGKRGPLGELPVVPPYFREEIDVVIKGRGITTFEQYAAVDRIGRRTPLRPEHRAAVWDLYCEYDTRLREAGVHDYADLLAHAYEEIRRRPPEPPYTCVVADEVQDLTLVAVRLLHALVGDREDGLLLVGDGSQALYPGGFRLSEAGIAVTGRSVRLTTNYRNSAAVLAAAEAVGATEVALDEGDVAVTAGSTILAEGRGPDGWAAGASDVGGGRPTGAVTRLRASSAAARDRLVLDAVLARVAAAGPVGCAVLVRSNAEVSAWRQRLVRAGLATCDLRDYQGDPPEAVVVGTLHRAKGLEFDHVFLPDGAPEPPRRSAEADASRAERAEPWRRGLYVGITRARSTVWCGTVEDVVDMRVDGGRAGP